MTTRMKNIMVLATVTVHIREANQIYYCAASATSDRELARTDRRPRVIMVNSLRRESISNWRSRQADINKIEEAARSHRFSRVRWNLRDRRALVETRRVIVGNEDRKAFLRVRLSRVSRSRNRMEVDIWRSRARGLLAVQVPCRVTNIRRFIIKEIKEPGREEPIRRKRDLKDLRELRAEQNDHRNRGDNRRVRLYFSL